MKRYGLVMLGTLLVPRVVAASNLGPFVDLAPVGTGIMSAAYLFGGAGIVWSGGHALSAYRSRDIEGMGAVWGWTGATAVGAILLGVLVPKFVAPIMAMGATL